MEKRRTICFLTTDAFSMNRFLYLRKHWKQTQNEEEGNGCYLLSFYTLNTVYVQLSKDTSLETFLLRYENETHLAPLVSHLPLRLSVQ